MDIQAGMGLPPAEFLQFGQRDPHGLLAGRAQREMRQLKGLRQPLVGDRPVVAIDRVAALAGVGRGVEGQCRRDHDFLRVARLAMGEAPHRVGLGHVILPGRVIVEQRLARRCIRGEPREGFFQRPAAWTGEKFVSVQRQDPVRAPVGRGEPGKMIAPRLLQVAQGLIGEDRQGQPLGQQLPHDFPRAIGAVMVEHQVVVDPRMGVPQERLDDIGFILHNRDGDKLHGIPRHG